MSDRPYGYAAEARLALDGSHLRPLIARQRLVERKRDAEICLEKWKTERWTQRFSSDTHIALRIVELYEGKK